MICKHFINLFKNVNGNRYKIVTVGFVNIVMTLYNL